MPLNPPPGWNALQDRAKQVKDPQELVALIEEMNQLLSKYESEAGDGDGNDRRPHKQKAAKKKGRQQNSS